MAWLTIFALGVATLVGCAVRLGRPRRARTPGFPWFWLVLPATCLAVAASIGAFTLWPQDVTGVGSVWWELSAPSTPAGQFLSGEQYHRITVWQWMARLLPVLSAAGLACCLWTWRRGRI